MASAVALIMEDSRLIEQTVQSFEFRAGAIIARLEDGCEVGADCLIGIRVDNQVLRWSHRERRMVPLR